MLPRGPTDRFWRQGLNLMHSHCKYWTTLAGNIEILSATVSSLWALVPHFRIVFRFVFVFWFLLLCHSLPGLSSEETPYLSGMDSCYCLFALCATAFWGWLRSRSWWIYCNHARDLSLWLLPASLSEKENLSAGRECGKCYKPQNVVTKRPKRIAHEI